MSSTSLYTLVAGASLLLALWQPADADMRLADQPQTQTRSAERIDRVGQKIDERAARHKERWEQRKAQRKLGGGGS